MQHSGVATPKALSQADTWCVSIRQSEALRVVTPGSADTASAGHIDLVLSGFLYNGSEIAAALPDPVLPGETDAGIVLRAYQRWGDEAALRMKGVFALVIWDSQRDTLICVRDPLGNHPLFVTKAGGAFLVADALDTLLRQPGVSAQVNRELIADHIRPHFPFLEETFYKQISRVPPGHLLTVRRGVRSVRRYWDPSRKQDGFCWASQEEVANFTQVLENTVQHYLRLGRAGIYLSGGLDSVSVAAVAKDAALSAAVEAPLALSLAFPDPEVDEAKVQREVAVTLGLEQVLAPFYEAVGTSDLLSAALELNRTWPEPLLMLWLPAYQNLANAARARGCGSILTGGGGDEWLCVSPRFAADLLRAGRFFELWQFWRGLQRSYHVSTAMGMRALFWNAALRPLCSQVRRYGHSQLQRLAPEFDHARLRRQFARGMPSWLAPDPSLYRELERRSQCHPSTAEGETFYLQDLRASLDHPLVSMEAEEMFESGRRAGLRILRPYWDADVVDLLYRIHPAQLMAGGRTKGLVRSFLAGRIPEAGFERQKKVDGTGFFFSEVRKSAAECWRSLGGARSLAAIGVVDYEGVSAHFQQTLETANPMQMDTLWDILKLESWLRPRL